MRILVVINPKAGSGIHLPFFLRKVLRLKSKKTLSSEALRQNIESALALPGVSASFEYTLYPGHATELAKKAASEGYDAVVATGGDGTVNEVVNGLAGSRTALGIIAAGTANLLAGELNLPSEIDLASAVIVSGRTRTIDLGMIEGRYFTIMAGVGFDAHVVRLVTRKLKGRWGAFSYFIVTLRELMRYSFPAIEIVTEEGERLRGYYLFVQNGRTYGSGFAASPDSQLNDGLLEVILFPERRFITVIQYLLSPRKGNFKVHRRTVRSIKILNSQEIQIDGDFFTQSPAEISICPSALRVLAP